jgi:hypothetical protein
MVVHACRPSYFGFRDQEDCDLKLRKLRISHLNIKTGVVVHTHNASYAGGHTQRDWDWNPAQGKIRDHIKK